MNLRESVDDSVMLLATPPTHPAKSWKIGLITQLAYKASGLLHDCTTGCQLQVKRKK